MAKWIVTGFLIGFAICGIVESVCDVGWGQYNDACYYISSEPTHSWQRARNWCMAEGGDLVSILSAEENSYVTELVSSVIDTSLSNLWIGLNQLSDRITLEWSDGSAVSHAHWQNGHPLNDQLNLCASIASSQSDYLWRSDNCGRKTGFMCKKPVDAAGSVTSPPTSSVPGYCPTGYFGTGNKCFKVFRPLNGQAVNWTTALNICRSQPGHLPDLASINSKEEQDVVLAQLRDVEVGMWIGLVTWIEDTAGVPWLWVDNSDVTFTNWQAGRPEEGNENCAEFLTFEAGMWTNTPCNQPRGYVCQTFKDSDAMITTPQPTPFPCPAGYTAYWYACYRLFSTMVTWSEADQSCKSSGGHLVSILNEPENAALIIYMNGQGPVWNGLTNSGTEEYVWSDGSPVYYTPWMAGEPSNDSCVVLTTSGTWDAVPCNGIFGYICKIATDLHPAPPTELYGFGVCPDDRWIPWGSHCYYFAESVIHFQDGASECRSLAGYNFFGSIVSIHSEAENRFIYETFVAKNLNDKESWIGLQETSVGSHEFAWDDGTLVDYTRWIADQPDFQPSTEQQCALMDLVEWRGHWKDSVCTTVDYKRAVCKTPQAGDPLIHCPSGEWLAKNINGSVYCYLYRGLAAERFNDAQEACIAEGGMLASIHSWEENWMIFFALRAMDQSGSSFIGLKRAGTGASFEWVDGTPMDFEWWYPGHPQPTGNCADIVHYSTDALWTSLDCGAYRSYVCKVESKLTAKSSIPPVASKKMG